MGAILINPQSNYAKEMAKHEQHHTQYTVGLQPGNPYVYREYPRMMYMARRVPGNGRWAVALEPPAYFGFRDANEWDRACLAADAFTRSCQTVVNSEEEYRRMYESGEGWRPTQKEALEFANGLDKLMGDEAAARAFTDRNLSDKAKAEVAAAEAEHFGHLPEIPEKPRQRKARKADSAAV